MADLQEYTSDVFEPLKGKMLSMIDESTYLREVSFAIQALNKSEYLAKCTKASILTAVYNTATTGLSLNPVLKYAALVPRYSKTDGVVAVLEPMYQGLVKLVTDTGSVKNAYAYTVCEGDDFSVEYGTTVEIKHKPNFKSKVITHAYAVGVLPDGTKMIEVMNKEDLDYIRGLSESYKAYADKKTKTCIWVDHESEMCRKTVLKRLVKYLPKTDKYEKLATAVDIDNSDYEISDGQQDYILRLLNTSTYGKDETGARLESKIMAGLTPQEYQKIKTDLLNNQLDPITHGGNYNQGDINRHLEKIK